jgi:hypothetical protein
MARKIIELVEVIDDVTGDVIAEEDSDIVRFSLDGVAFKLETSKDQANGFREMFAKYIACAAIDEDAALTLVRKPAAPIRTRTAVAPRGPRRNTGHNLNMVRQWAIGEGYEVGDRGRIPMDIKESYAQAHNVSVDDLMPVKG